MPVPPLQSEEAPGTDLCIGDTFFGLCRVDASNSAQHNNIMYNCVKTTDMSEI